MTDTLRIALVGAWHVHANDYARDCENNPHTRLVVVWDDNAERGHQAADHWQVPYNADLEAVLADPDLDGVIITTATVQHREVMEKVIAAGKHIYTEKVLAATTEDAEAIAKSAKEAGMVLTVSLPRLYTGYTQAIERILAISELGEPSYIRVRVSHDGAVRRNGNPQWLPETFFDRSQALGGAMIDFGAHPYYLVHRFAGLPESITASYLSVSGHEVEDQALVVCNYPGKLTGVAEASFLGGAMGMFIEIHGSDGSLLFDFDEGLRTKLRGESDWTIRDLPADGVTPFDRWVDRIQRGEQDLENVAEALALTRIRADRT
jgi:predicted dehydrogenase